MLITATELKTNELKTNIGKCLVLAETEDIIVTKNNKPIAKITNIQEDKLSILNSIVGIIPNNGYTLEYAKSERLAKQ